jgi:predicted nucleic acid-binding protein
MRPVPDTSVQAWIASQPLPLLYTTSITQAEILLGLQLLPNGKRRNALEVLATQMFDEDFPGRVLSFDSRAATQYARIVTERRRLGRPIMAFDAQIAAIAAAANASLATHNVGDFDSCGLRVVNPWVKVD